MKNFNEIMMKKRKITGEFTRSDYAKSGANQERVSGALENNDESVSERDAAELAVRSERAKSGALYVKNEAIARQSAAKLAVRSRAYWRAEEPRNEGDGAFKV